ncbi:MAG: helix-turn-helix transcriptional regulator [Umezawaea sp.]
MAASRNRAALAQFLRSRRERITPEHVGLPFGPRRRTPGLRREEIAVLAGLSPTWYTYLEQGRDIRPSPEVLESLARVLKLTEDERRYLHVLATGQSPPPVPTAPVCPDEVLMGQVIAAMGSPELPLYAGNVYADVTAWNAATVEWYTDFGALPADRRNVLWWMLTAPEARERIVDWEDDTRDVLARFRVAAAARPWDRRFDELTSLLEASSPEFRSWWSDHDVREQHARPRRMRRPNGEVVSMQLVVLRMADSVNSVVLHLAEDWTPGGR